MTALVMKNTGKEYKTAIGNFNSSNGELRRLNVTAGRGGKSYMSYQKVPKRLDDFCNWINAQRKTISKDDVDNLKKAISEYKHSIENDTLNLKMIL